MTDNTPLLVTAAIEFFKRHDNPGFLDLVWGSELGAELNEAMPEHRFEVLLEACGCKGDPDRFFRRAMGSDQPVPAIFLTWVMAKVWPGNRLMSVKTPDDLKALGIPMPEDHRLQQVMDQYPVRLSDHIIRQSQVSPAVAAQYLPFCGELDTHGQAATFEGHFKTGVVEQMYQNRVIFLLTMRCPVYCRFCFRKHKELRREKSPTIDDIRAAIQYVADRPQVHEILITGGEPLMNRKNLEAALSGLTDIHHVRVIRIATRSVAYFPRLFLEKEKDLIRFLAHHHALLRKTGKRLEIGVHFVHADEVSMESLEIISAFTRAGIRVYLQTPYLGGVNNSGPAPERLFTLLASAGCEIYYIFTPCHPIQGTRAYWTPISDAIDAYTYLRAHLSDRLMPKLCTATSLGKIEWQSSGWAVEPDGPDHIWIRTPYTQDYFTNFTPDLAALPDVRKNGEGTLDVRMMADVGNKTLFTTPPKALRTGHPQNPTKNIGLNGSKQDIQLPPPSPCDSLVRSHLTRVETDVAENRQALDYIHSQNQITDVILHQIDQADPQTLETLLASLKNIPHIQRVRVCSPGFHDNPERFTQKWLDHLSAHTSFSPANPFKIEIETWFTQPDEITPDHGDAAAKFNAAGIPVYANVPLLSGVNTHPDTMTKLAHTLRRAHIDFHHLYVAGLPIQDRINKDHPINNTQVIAIASEIRKNCSGREIPLYIIKTVHGEADFGLIS